MISEDATVLFIFAHQDDEFCASQRIRRAILRGDRVLCVYLTDGEGHGTSSTRRDSESRKALKSLGVPIDHIAFIGSTNRIADGSLWRGLDDAVEYVLQALAAWCVSDLSRVYTLAWEGGHADHDAACLVALAVARSFDIVENVWELPAYHGRGLPGMLFRMMSPLHKSEEAEIHTLSPAQGLRAAFFWLHYPSQFRSWLGLFPEAFIKYAVLRRDFSQPALYRNVLARPHPGPLLYERMRRATYEDILEAACHSRHVGAFIQELNTRA